LLHLSSGRDVDVPLLDDFGYERSPSRNKQPRFRMVKPGAGGSLLAFDGGAPAKFARKLDCNAGVFHQRCRPIQGFSVQVVWAFRPARRPGPWGEMRSMTTTVSAGLWRNKSLRPGGAKTRSDADDRGGIGPAAPPSFDRDDITSEKQTLSKPASRGPPTSAPRYGDIPLKEAWKRGGQKLSPYRRIRTILGPIAWPEAR